MNARARIATNGRGHWFSTVWDSHGLLVVTDDGTNRAQLTAAAIRDVTVVRRIEQMGHRLTTSYSALVDAEVYR